MPELPDVEVYKRYLDATSLHQEIQQVEIRASKLVKGTALSTLREELTGAGFERTRRHGKWLFAGINSGTWLVLHFGMTGELKYFQDLDDDPAYDQLLISFVNGCHLAYSAPRKLGEFRIIQEVEGFLHAKELGPDVMDLDRNEFLSLLSGRRGMLKTALMDQSLMAGIGNVYSDEVLYQVGLHPRTEIKHLTEEVLGEVFSALHEVVDTAVEHGAEPEEFPADYLTPHRQPGTDCPRCEGQIERIKVSGRSAYCCPSCQDRPGS